MREPTEPSPAGQTSRPEIILVLGAAFGALLALLVRYFQRLRGTAPYSPLEAPPSPETADPAAQAGLSTAKSSAVHQPHPGTAVRPTGGRISTRWSKTTKYIVAVFLFLAVIAILVFSRNSLSLIFFAGLLAFLVHPLIRFFQQRWRMPKGAAVLLTYLLVLLMLFLIPFILLPQIIDSVNFIANLDFQAIAQDIAAWAEQASAQVGRLPLIGALLQSALDALALALQGTPAAETSPTVAVQLTVESFGMQLASMLGSVVNVVTPIVAAILSVVFMLLIALQMNLSGDRVLNGLPKLLPPGYQDEFSDLFRRIGGIWNAFMGGQVLLMVTIGAVTVLANWIIGTPQPLLLGVIAGFMEVIPSLGPLIAWIPAVLLALLFGSTHFAIDPLIFALVVTLVYLGIQTLENQVVVPYVLGDSLDLPPVVVLIGVTIGGSALGILGIFLASPVIATGKEVFEYLYAKILEPPEPELPEPEKISIWQRMTGAVKSIRLPRRAAPEPEKTPVKTPAPVKPEQNAHEQG
jgi:predicted PurR-regulated permease PerM